MIIIISTIAYSSRNLQKIKDCKMWSESKNSRPDMFRKIGIWQNLKYSQQYFLGRGIFRWVSRRSANSSKIWLEEFLEKLSSGIIAISYFWNSLQGTKVARYLLYYILKIEFLTVTLKNFQKRFQRYPKILRLLFPISTVQKMKFSIKDFFSKCDQIRRKLLIWSNLPKKSLTENFIFLQH